MKNQTLFSYKDKSKKLKCCLVQFLFGALRIRGHSSKVDCCLHHYEMIFNILQT